MSASLLKFSFAAVKVFSITLFTFFILSYSTSYAKNIVVGGTAYWSPFCYTLPDAPHKLRGFTVDVVKHIFKDEVQNIQFLELPWKRCLLALENNKINLLLDGTNSSKRLQKFIFSDTIYYLDNVFFYSKKKYHTPPVVKYVIDVADYTLGGLSGSNYDLYPFDVSQAQVTSPDYKSLLAMVDRERFDFAMGFKQVIVSYAKMNNISMNTIGWIPMPEVEPLKFYILATKSPEGEKLIKLINSGLKKMKEDGTFKKIAKQYGLEDLLF
ncbi:substrate-binding periplasmic protein [Maridesulfovibrio zosterae]|uniref:substrate-binding periplasmic protein n=1 Tax=Maridesulfovibrio zosterae TaxID=82171 RepID=UPI000483D221|nr:transporter substrate-binding domain-containing protein [Maridesulfovibrio zosterae]